MIRVVCDITEPVVRSVTHKKASHAMCQSELGVPSHNIFVNLDDLHLHTHCWDCSCSVLWRGCGVFILNFGSALGVIALAIVAEVSTVESRFYRPQRETNIGSKNRRVREMGGKITVFDWGGETTFDSSYREVREIGIPLYVMTFRANRKLRNNSFLCSMAFSQTLNAIFLFLHFDWFLLMRYWRAWR